MSLQEGYPLDASFHASETDGLHARHDETERPPAPCGCTCGHAGRVGGWGGVDAPTYLWGLSKRRPAKPPRWKCRAQLPHSCLSACAGISCTPLAASLHPTHTMGEAHVPGLSGRGGGGSGAAWPRQWPDVPGRACPTPHSPERETSRVPRKPGAVAFFPPQASRGQRLVQPEAHTACRAHEQGQANKTAS